MLTGHLNINGVLQQKAGVKVAMHSNLSVSSKLKAHFWRGDIVEGYKGVT